MRKDRISTLRCPRDADHGCCRGTLELSDAVTLVLNSDDPNDVLEGVLCCSSCPTLYPIIQGVLILVPDVEGYVSANYHEICQELVKTTSSSSPASKTITGFLREHYLRNDESGISDEWNQSRPEVLNCYIQSHYGSLTERLLEANDASWAEFVSAQGRLPDVLLSMLHEIPDYPNLTAGLAVDVGCSVGGMAYLLAAEFKFVYGVDYSFTAVLNARRIVLKSPVPQTSYNLKLDVGMWSDDISLELAKRTNVEFLIASGEALPFESEKVDCLTSLNVIDVLQRPQELFTEAARILKAGKPFVLSDPYCWRKEGRLEVKQSSLGSSGYVSSNLSKCGFAVLNRKNSPWLLRLHDRRWDVYLCECLLALKSPAQGR